MKRIFIILILCGIVVNITSCNTSSKEHFDLNAIKSYRDIPGVTEEEIAAVEELKATRESFSYGHLTETEAFILPDGTYAGFTTKFCELLSNLFDAKFIQEFHDWDDLKGRLDDRSIDFTGDLTPTTERMQVYHMTHAIADRSLRIFWNIDSPDILFESDLNGLKVGFLKGSVDAESVAKSYPALIYEKIDCAGFADAAQKLKAHEIDVFVTEGIVDPIFDQYDFIRSKEFFPLVFTPVSMATANSELEPMISVVNKYLVAGGIDKLFELYKVGDAEYANYKLNQSFTDEEKAFINDLSAKGGKVSIALENDNYPVSFYNKSEKEFQGISIDVLREVSRLTGIEFKTATDETTTWAEIFEKLRTGEISMVSQLLYSDERKNDDFIWTDVPYSSAYYALLSKSDYPSLSSYQVLRARVGTVRKSAHEDMYNEWFPNNSNALQYDTQNEGLEALEKGEIDLLMGSEYTQLTQTNYHEKSGYKVNILFNTPMDSLFGFHKDMRVLCSIINKAQLYINTNSIAKNWISRVFDYSKKLATERSYYMMISVAILLSVLIFIVILLINNKRLSKNLEDTVKKRTHELERQTTTLSTIFTSIPDLVFCKDMNGKYTNCNPSFEKFAGVPMAELVGKTDREIFRIDERMAASFMQEDKDMLGRHETKVFEEVITYPDGTQYTVETAKMSLLSASGECVGLLGISRDVTHRKKTVETLKLTLDNLNTCIYINEIETGKILFINKKMMAEFGGGNFDGEVCWQVLQNGFQEQCSFCPMPKLLDTGDDSYVWEEHNTVTDKYYQNTDSLVKWQDGKLVHMQHSVDITDSVKLQRELKAAISKLEAVVKNYAGIIWSIDIDRKFTLYDGVLVSKMGVDSKAVIGQPMHSVMSGMPEYITYIENTFQEGPQSWIYTFGNMILNSNTIPQKDANGKTIGVVGASYDVTQSVKLQQDLKHASKAKSDFLSRMSHEIRTPMNAIIGMTKIADGSSDLKKIRYCLSTIDSASQHLLGLINDILDMSKIEAGKFELDNEYFNIEKMLMKICNLIVDKTDQKKQTLSISIGKKMHLNYLGDEMRLSQVITNLLSNAVKFTPEEGKITLTVDENQTDGDLVTIRFSVSDTGIGISPEQIQKLFTSFEQADGSISRRYGGTGLGLAISKNIIEKMNGQVWVKSELGKGSSFIFDIQMECSKEHKSGIIFDGITASDLKLLIVDGSKNVREQFLDIVKNFEIYSDEAENTEKAILLIDKAYIDQKPYDVIFLDSDMLKMDGIETIKRLNGKIDKNTVIIMMSFSQSSEAEDAAKRLGIQRFMNKMLFPSSILNAINEVIGKTIKTLDMKTSSPEKAIDFSDVSILLVEDVEINREIFISLMGETNMKIDVAENGLIAVQKFRDNPTKYDIIIMDIQMPEMDGYEATSTIRSLDVHGAKTIPIIAMTANAFKEDIDKCIASGMNDHISKPIDVGNVMEKVMRYRKK